MLSDNSDKQGYFEKVDWDKEYMKVRFTTPYLVYKLKPVWMILDKAAQITFALISLFIMILSNYWQISLAMFLFYVCFISLCYGISSTLYENRGKEKRLY